MATWRQATEAALIGQVRKRDDGNERGRGVPFELRNDFVIRGKVQHDYVGLKPNRCENRPVHTHIVNPHSCVGEVVDMPIAVRTVVHKENSGSWTQMVEFGVKVTAIRWNLRQIGVLSTRGGWRTNAIHVYGFWG